MHIHHAISLLFFVLPMSCATADGESTPGTTSEHPRTEWAKGNYIINLYDAIGTPSAGLTQDFGFSALVRYNGTTILFDSGTNADILKANTKALGIDLREVDFAVASHAHFDHINGFDYLLQVNPTVKIFFPADMFWGANSKFSVAGAEKGAADGLGVDQRYFGGEKEEFEFNQSGRFWKANVEYVAGHKEVAPGVTLVTTRSKFVGYFTRYPGLELDGLEKASGDIQTIGLPELSMNLASPSGDVLLVGCSHSLVETIVRATKDHLGRRLGLVYGGYHLLPYPAAKILEVAKRLKNELGVEAVAPAHCTGHAGFRVFQHVFADRYHKAGLGTTTAFPGSR